MVDPRPVGTGPVGTGPVGGPPPGGEEIVAIRLESLTTGETRLFSKVLIKLVAAFVNAIETKLVARVLNRSLAAVVQSVHAALDVVPMAARPTVTLAAAGWTNELGGDSLHPSVDELEFDDADYIQSSVDPVNDTALLGLNNPSYEMLEPIVLRIRAKRVASAALTVKLFDGAAEILSRPVVGLTDTLQTFEYALDASEVVAFKASSNRRLALVAS